MKWSYGVTTCPKRLDELLPRTLESLRKAGFDNPRIFVDGPSQSAPVLAGREVVFRGDNIRTFGNWVLAAWELYLREPHADYYALFQDDFVTYPRLREYLEQCKYPARGYWNLYTFPENKRKFRGWYQSNQKGLGAVALVFNNEAIRTVLSSEHMVNRPLNPERGWRAIDGGIVDSFKKAGWREYVHNPSLVQHTGHISSMGNGVQEQADTFMGEDYDIMNLLTNPVEVEKKVYRRIGLVGYNCNTGLGELNRQLAEYGNITTWLVQPHPVIPTNPPNDNVDTIVCKIGRPTKMDKFLDVSDVIVFAERPYYETLIDKCVHRSKRTVCIPMMEWMPPAARTWPQQVDLFICPTKQCFNLFSHVVPCVYFPWPVDTERFQYKPRKTCEKFLFIAGHGGYKGRKGIEVIQRALQLWPDMPIAIRSQERSNWPKGTEILGETESNADLYGTGDVLISPHSVDGLGLEPMEAMATGMPVITTLGEPWNEIPAIGRIPGPVQRRTVKRPVDWYLPSSEKLVEICRELLGKSIETESGEARAWAESRSWRNNTERFSDLVRSGTPEKAR